MADALTSSRRPVLDNSASTRLQVGVGRWSRPTLDSGCAHKEALLAAQFALSLRAALDCHAAKLPEPVCEEEEESPLEDDKPPTSLPPRDPDRHPLWVQTLGSADEVSGLLKDDELGMVIKTIVGCDP